MFSPPPILTHAPPPCPICRKTTRRVDGRLKCAQCACTWDAAGGDAQWMNPDAVRCPEVHEPAPGYDTVHVCVLPAGHKRVHRSLDPRLWWKTRQGFILSRT